eukprot:Platyproteum_vivax@DN4125_c0_g1_i1.p1
MAGLKCCKKEVDVERDEVIVVEVEEEVLVQHVTPAESCNEALETVDELVSPIIHRNKQPMEIVGQMKVPMDAQNEGDVREWISVIYHNCSHLLTKQLQPAQIKEPRKLPKMQSMPFIALEETREDLTVREDRQIWLERQRHLTCDDMSEIAEPVVRRDSSDLSRIYTSSEEDYWKNLIEKSSKHRILDQPSSFKPMPSISERDKSLTNAETETAQLHVDRVRKANENKYLPLGVRRQWASTTALHRGLAAVFDQDSAVVDRLAMVVAGGVKAKKAKQCERSFFVYGPSNPTVTSLGGGCMGVTPGVDSIRDKGFFSR